MCSLFCVLPVSYVLEHSPEILQVYSLHRGRSIGLCCKALAAHQASGMKAIQSVDCACRCISETTFAVSEGEKTAGCQICTALS